MIKEDLMDYPVGAFKFAVEIDGILAGGFNKVSGMGSEMETREIKEGGENNIKIKLFEGIKYNNITLSKGVGLGSALWDWYYDVIDGKHLLGLPKKSGSIILYDNAGTEVSRWDFTNAYPIKWKGPDLNAQEDSSIAIEEYELVVEKIVLSKSKSVIGMVLDAIGL